MTARDDVLAAARALVRRGIDPFSPAQVIREARTQGSTYMDSTLSTHVTNHMCVNSPDHSAVQYHDLVRVTRGKYRLNDATAHRAALSALSAPAPNAIPIHREPPPERPWSWEGNVQATVVRHLEAHGWKIRRVADTYSKEAGIDVEATLGARELLIEVKGYPSERYERGARQGQKKSNHATQARHYFGGALLTATLMRAANPDAEVVIALPRYTTYENLARRTSDVFYRIGVQVWLIDESGHVDQVGAERPGTG